MVINDKSDHDLPIRLTLTGGATRQSADTSTHQTRLVTSLPQICRRTGTGKIAVVVVCVITATLNSGLGFATEKRADFLKHTIKTIHFDLLFYAASPTGVACMGTNPGNASTRASHALTPGYAASDTSPSGACAMYA